MIRVNIDYPVNALDNMYVTTKKTVQDIVTASYDDIDNIIPNDVVDIDFTPDDKDSKLAVSQTWISKYTDKIKQFFSK